METPIINVISLPHRIDRKIHIVSEFKQQGITNYEFWNGIVASPPFVGIQRAHKQIVKDAKNKGLDMCCICEDDIKFSDIGSWKYFIENIPKKFDLYLSSIYWGEIDEYNIVKDFSSLTLYIIHSGYYDTFLNTPEIGHLDRSQCIRIPPENIPQPHGKFIVCNPFISYQIEGFSDNVQHETDYFNTYMKGRRFFTNLAKE